MPPQKNNTFTKLAVASGVSLALTSVAMPVNAGVINLGTLLGDGAPVVVSGNIDSNNPLDFINFSISGAIQNVDLSYLNIQSPPFNPDDLSGGDTKIGLYDSGGIIIAQAEANGPFPDDLLTFGNADPLAAPYEVPGTDGTLLAGDYTLAVSGWISTMATNIDEISPDTSPRDYSVQITYLNDVQPVPEPAGLGLFVMGAFGLWLSGIKRRLKKESR